MFLFSWHYIWYWHVNVINKIYHALSKDHCLRKRTKVLQQEWKNMAKLKKGTCPPKKRGPGMDLDRLPSEALLPLLWSSQWSMCGYSVSLWRWCFSTRISCLGAGKRLETFKNIEVIGKLTEFCLRKEEGGWYGPPPAWGTHLELTPGWLLPPLQTLPLYCPLVSPPRFFVQKLGGAAIENDHLGVLAEIQRVNIMNCGKELGNTAIIFDGKNVLHILGHESFIPTLHHL